MIIDYLQVQLEKQQIELSSFQAVVQRLLDYGAICRDESQTEQELYDLYLRLQRWIDDYLLVIGIRVQHDAAFNYIRLYPPGAPVPSMDDDGSSFSGFRTRPSQHEVAMLLVLRSQYEQRLREGQIDDHGCAAVSLEALSIAMKSLLNRTLPLQSTERKTLFRNLKRMRVIQFSHEELLETGEAWIRIRPMITSLVTHEVLHGLLASDVENNLDPQSLAEDLRADDPDDFDSVTIDSDVDTGMDDSVDGGDLTVKGEVVSSSLFGEER